MGLKMLLWMTSRWRDRACGPCWRIASPRRRRWPRCRQRRTGHGEPRRQAFDGVLLDIHMPGADGLALAQVLRTPPEPPVVVFVTAYAEHAVSAFELEAVDYLTKPVRMERLEQALARVEKARQAQAARSRSRRCWSSRTAAAPSACRSPKCCISRLN